VAKIRREIFITDNEAVVDFVYSSNLFRKVREAYLKGNYLTTSQKLKAVVSKL
jgi:hypothetical protein